MAIIDENTTTSVIVNFPSDEDKEEAKKLLAQLVPIADETGMDATGLWTTDPGGKLIPLIGPLHDWDNSYHWEFNGDPRSAMRFLKQIADTD